MEIVKTYGSVYSVLLLSTPGLFLTLRKSSEHITASRGPKFFCLLETILSCSTLLSMLNHCLLPLISNILVFLIKEHSNDRNVKVPTVIQMHFLGLLKVKIKISLFVKCGEEKTPNLGGIFLGYNGKGLQCTTSLHLCKLLKPHE